MSSSSSSSSSSMPTGYGFATAAVIVTAILWYLKRSGLFYRPKVSVTEAPARRVAYKHHTGPYNDCGQFYTSACHDVQTALTTDKKNRSTTSPSFAVFADDPAEIPAKSLRYAVGVVLSEGENVKRDEMVEAELTRMGYTIVDLPACKAIRTEFPFYNMISILLSVRRVYPLIYGYVRENNLTPKGQESLPCYEVCSCRTHATEYILPVDGDIDLSVFRLGLTSTAEYAKTLKKV